MTNLSSLVLLGMVLAVERMPLMMMNLDIIGCPNECYLLVVVVGNTFVLRAFI